MPDEPKADVSEEYAIRPMRADDLPFLWDMLWEAFSSDLAGMDRDEGLALPEVAKYLDGWGREGDEAVVAESPEGVRLGAAWYRVFPPESPGYGFVAADVPELSITVAPGARGRGIGGELIRTLQRIARGHGYARMSLSVSRRNPARRLYERQGFGDAGVSRPTDASVTLVAGLGEG